MKLTYRSEIDGLRAIAVASVVIYHAEFAFGGDVLLSGGFLGVDIFFVISGFLISSILLNELRDRQKISLWTFYERRARRILPALFAVMVASVVAAWFLLSPQALSDFGGSGLAALFFGSNFWFWQDNSYTAIASQLQPFLHTWTLSLEEQFYVIFPLLLAFLHRFGGKVIVGTIIALFVASLVLAQFGSALFPNATFYLLPTRGWELLAGSMIALAPRFSAILKGRRTSIFADLICLPALILIVLCLIFFEDSMAHPSVLTAIPVLSTAVLLWASAEAGATRALLSLRPMVVIGLISYSLYLWHFPVFAFARVALGDLAVIEKSILIGVSGALAAASYSIVETPFRNKRDVGLSRLIILLGTTFGALIIAFGLFYSGKLKPTRYAILENVIDFTYNYNQDWRVGSCFIQPAEMTRSDTFDNCQIEKFGASKPTMMLWGDSHAAHHYQGIAYRYSDKYNIVQRTSSQCAPIPGRVVENRPGCKEINDKVLDEIAANPPDVLLLAAAWWPAAPRTLEPVIQRLRASGVENISIIGPVPWWDDSLPEQLAEQIRSAGSAPLYMKRGLVPRYFDVDAELERYALSSGIGYRSPIQALCRNLACLTRVGDAPNEITQFDYGHLTRSGSIYVASRFPEE